MSEANCLFCKIVEGEIPAYKVYEDKKVLGFLDVNPISDGHIIVIPRKHVEEFYQLDNEDYKTLMDVVKKLSVCIKNVYNPPRVGVVVYGFHVSHAHIHLYPNTGTEVTMHHISDYPREKLEQELEKLAKALTSNT